MSNLANLYSADKAAQAGDGNYEPLAAGVYKVMITESELKQTQKGGTRLALEMVVVGENGKDKKLWDGLNLVCPGSAMAENIAQKHLTSICEQISVDPSNPSFGTEDLKMKPFDVELKVEAYTDNEGNPKKRNAVASYKPSKSAGVSQSPTTQAPAEQPCW